MRWNLGKEQQQLRIQSTPEELEEMRWFKFLRSNVSLVVETESKLSYRLREEAEIMGGLVRL